MTEQTPIAMTVLNGTNADYVDQLQARFAADPGAVDPEWQAFFRSLGETEVDAKRAARGPSWARPDWPPMPMDELTSALTG